MGPHCCSPAQSSGSGPAVVALVIVSHTILGIPLLGTVILHPGIVCGAFITWVLAGGESEQGNSADAQNAGCGSERGLSCHDRSSFRTSVVSLARVRCACDSSVETKEPPSRRSRCQDSQKGVHSFVLTNAEVT